MVRTSKETLFLEYGIDNLEANWRESKSQWVRVNALLVKFNKGQDLFTKKFTGEDAKLRSSWLFEGLLHCSWNKAKGIRKEISLTFTEPEVLYDQPLIKKHLILLGMSYYITSFMTIYTIDYVATRLLEIPRYYHMTN